MTTTHAGCFRWYGKCKPEVERIIKYSTQVTVLLLHEILRKIYRGNFFLTAGVGWVGDSSVVKKRQGDINLKLVVFN